VTATHVTTATGLRCAGCASHEVFLFIVAGAVRSRCLDCDATQDHILLPLPLPKAV
jgi:hypothetical protein